MEDNAVDNANNAENTEVENSKVPKRILLAVGDLHGDYYRLLRHLRELELLIPGTMAWNPERNNVDLVLIGDYTDWRGEPIEELQEETPEESSTGGYRILSLILHLDRELALLRKVKPEFDSHFYPLIGNHDDMMLHSAEVFDFVSVEDLQELLPKARNYNTWKRQLTDHGMDNSQVEHMFSFLNWYVQGGEITINGFGGMQAWKEAMKGEIGQFMRERLYLAVVVNDRLFSHSLPDQSKYWRPLEEIAALPQAEYDAARECFTWGRKVWGYDYQSGVRTSPFTPKELASLLGNIGGSSAVVGHTPLSHTTEHVVAYDGQVINIDVHGNPGGKAFVEEYRGLSSGNRAP